MATDQQTDDECNLETLLAKATNPVHKEPQSEFLASFCQLVDKEHDGPQKALRLLAHKIQSPLEKESLLALIVLEKSMNMCGTKFRSEVGKFRFLNEMIKVVSPKYLGNRASPKVKQKIIELMYLWSIEMKQELKIFEAYQMLKRQGVVSEDPVYIIEDCVPIEAPPPRPKNEVFDDEVKAQQLQRLLGSRNPADLQAANKLIKSMVQESDRRMELLAKKYTEIETGHNNAKVLADMLDHFSTKDTSNEEKELMKELFESCEQLRPKLFRLAGQFDEKDDNVAEILKVIDELTIVITRYKKVMNIATDVTSGNERLSSESETNGASLLDLGTPEQPNAPSSYDCSLLDDQLLALGLNDAPETSLPAYHDNRPASEQLTDLEKIFNVGDSVAVSSFSRNMQSMTTHGLMMPMSTTGGASVTNSHFMSGVSNMPDVTSGSSSSNTKESASATLASKGLEELDELGQSMLKQSLTTNTSVKIEFPSTPQKIPLRDLKSSVEQQKVPVALKEEPVFASDNLSTNSVLVPERLQSQSPNHEALSLADIFVPLETIQPGSLPPMTLLENNGVTVVIHLGKNSPRPDVSVMVVSTMSKNSSPIKNVMFQAAVPKSMKIKLQPPSATDLPPHNPILPPAAITQVLLLANPQKEKVRFKYKLNYSVNNEDRTETGDVDNLFSER